jgi:hypothetical protein
MSEQVVSIRVGDIFRIALPDGRFAFGCVLRDASVGIYSGTFSTPTFPAGWELWSFAFVVAIYSDILPSGMCPIIGHREFKSQDDEWPPPKCYFDPQAKTVSIYYKGRFVPCRAEDVVGLEMMQVCELAHVIQRIMNTQPEIEPDDVEKLSGRASKRKPKGRKSK